MLYKLIYFNYFYINYKTLLGFSQSILNCDEITSYLIIKKLKQKTFKDIIL